jgi:Uma2 family endonuclease
MAIEYRTEPEYCEWLDGEAHPKVSPRDAHGRAQARLAHFLFRSGAERYGSVATELDAVIEKRDGTKTKLIPDVSFVLAEQRAGLSKRDIEEPPYSPAIAIEVWSPGDTREYLQRKFRRFLATGSQLILDVRIKQGTVTATTADGSRVFEIGETFSTERFPWLTFTLEELFRDLR